MGYYAVYKIDDDIDPSFCQPNKKKIFPIITRIKDHITIEIRLQKNS